MFLIYRFEPMFQVISKNKTTEIKFELFFNLDVALGIFAPAEQTVQ